MIPYLFVFPVIAIIASAVFLVRGSIMRARAEAETPAVPAPEPRTPADTTRTYPRPKGSRSKLNRVCPVCGSGDETGALDGRVLGWPAHRSCAEWLGEWKPAIKAGPADHPPAPNFASSAFTGATPPDTKPGRSITVSGNLTGIASTGDGAVNVAYTGGTAITMGGADRAALENLVAMQEMFLDSEMRRTYGKPPKPVFPEYCTCGKEFTGTAEQNRQALDTHHASGECPHTPKRRHLEGFEVG